MTAPAPPEEDGATRGPELVHEGTLDRDVTQSANPARARAPRARVTSEIDRPKACARPGPVSFKGAVMELTRRSLVTGAAAGLVTGLVELTSAPGATAASPLPTPRARPTQYHRPMGWGASGPAVLAMQRRLVALGYWLGTPDGRFGHYTRQAVWALQKAAGLPRTGTLTLQTRSVLDRGVRPRPRARSGTVIEVDKRHQLILVVSQGRLRYAINTSTGGGYWYTTSGGGRARATTPSGHFRIYYRWPSGWQHGSLGDMWRPAYFHGGWAIHGSSAIPPYPASHGCARVTTGAMNMLYAGGWVPVGRSVHVY